MVILSIAFVVIFGAVIATAFYTRRKANFLAAQLAQSTANVTRAAWEAGAIRRLVPEGTLLPQPGAWSLDSDTLSWLVTELEARRPACVVELGSGLSTIVLGLKLRALGHGRLISIDHDPKFAEQTRSWVDFHRLHDVVEIRLAPLQPRPGQPQEPPWYDEAALTDLNGVAMLVVDGPPMTTLHPDIRAAALPFFAPRFTGDWVIYFDDANRPGERRFLTHWRTAQPSVKVEFLPFPKGGAVVRPSGEGVEA